VLKWSCDAKEDRKQSNEVKQGQLMSKWSNKRMKVIQGQKC
jgi:hypothetical protein